MNIYMEWNYKYKRDKFLWFITPSEPVVTIDKIKEKIAEKYYISPTKEQIQFATKTLIKPLLEISKGAVQSLVLRIIAVELDSWYENNIRQCDYIWVIDQVGGKIKKISTEKISKNAWQYFAAFRNQEDAIYAVQLLKRFLDNLYEQKD